MRALIATWLASDAATMRMASPRRLWWRALRFLVGMLTGGRPSRATLAGSESHSPQALAYSITRLIRCPILFAVSFLVIHIGSRSRMMWTLEIWSGARCPMCGNTQVRRLFNQTR